MWDLLIRGALVFDGLGGPPKRLDVATSKGRIAGIGEHLDPSQAAEVIHADGRWLLPGLVDMHTHLDVELEVAPGLQEVVRHGTTTVIVGNCSLGLAYGAEPSNDRDDPLNSSIVDCFARVENIPKSVLARAVDRRVTWSDPGSYLDHLEMLPLGPNVAVLAPHSMLRMQVMGVNDAITRCPTEAELDIMCTKLNDALRAGCCGMSTDGMPLHYMANDPHRDRRVPATHARQRERKALVEVVRNYDAVVQYTPDSDRRIALLRFLSLTCGRLHRFPVRMTITAVLDMVSNRRAKTALLTLAGVLNSRFLNGRLVLQALPAPFTVSGDGPVSPLMEEMPSFRELTSLDLEDRTGRTSLLKDPDFVRRFRRDWNRGSRRLTPSWIARRLGLRVDTFPRDFDAITITDSPIPAWNGLTCRELRDRCRRSQPSVTGEETSALDELRTTVDDADFFAGLLRLFDRDMRWEVTAANPEPKVVEQLLFAKHALPGFNDSGAHLTNLAYLDGNLRTLQIAAKRSLGTVGEAVRRITWAPADLFGLDVGTIDIGASADLTLIDPDALRAYNPQSATTMAFRPELGHQQMVNRSDGVVPIVVIGGHVVWRDNRPNVNLGHLRFGRLLRRHVPAGFPRPAIHRFRVIPMAGRISEKEPA